MYMMIAVPLLSLLVSAHSWVEQAQRVNATGFYAGPIGFPRMFVSRADEGFRDANMTYKLPPPQRNRIDSSDLTCSPFHARAQQSEGFPQLLIAPGEYLALKYLENGHVTLPQTPLGKPKGSGTVAIYGIVHTDDDLNPPLLHVLSWNYSAPLVDGRLLTAQSFDDARCYQLNPASSISNERRIQFPNYIPGQGNAVHEQWCESSVRIPDDVPSSTKLTLYWIWAWPTLPNIDANVVEGKDEFYTSCLDLIVSNETFPSQLTYSLPYQDPQAMAVTNFRQRASSLDVRLLHNDW